MVALAPSSPRPCPDQKEAGVPLLRLNVVSGRQLGLSLHFRVCRLGLRLPLLAWDFSHEHVTQSSEELRAPVHRPASSGGDLAVGHTALSPASTK